MKNLICLIALTGALSLQAQSVKTIQLNELQQMIDTKGTKPRLYNFWASWCAPCVKELPDLASLNQSGKVEVILVSLDFPQDLAKAQAILQKKQLKINSLLLNESDYDKIIPLIDENWSGAIPASLVVEKSGKKYFYEKSFNQQELDELVNKHTTK